VSLQTPRQRCLRFDPAGVGANHFDARDSFLHAFWTDGTFARVTIADFPPPLSGFAAFVENSPRYVAVMLHGAADTQ